MTMPATASPQVLRAARDAAFNREPFAPRVPFDQQAPGDGPESAMAQLHTSFAAELDTLHALADQVAGLPDPVLRRRLAHVLDFLQDIVVPHMQIEERVLHPGLDSVMRAVGGGTRTMAVDHRLIEDLVGGVADVSSGALDAEERREITRILDGLDVVLRGHLAKEAEVYLPLLARLSSPEQARLAAALVDHSVDASGQPRPTLP